MNTWGYLLIIAALAAMAAYMLYARFGSRSREKSAHHSLEGFFASDAEAPPSTTFGGETSAKPSGAVADTGDAAASPASPAADGEEIVEEDGSRGEGAGIPLAGETRTEALPDEALVRAEPRAAQAGSASGPESEYIDELQEAAAGLAKLMRSSPLARRSEPVVFAPEASDGADVEESHPLADEAGGGAGEGVADLGAAAEVDGSTDRDEVVDSGTSQDEAPLVGPTDPTSLEPLETSEPLEAPEIPETSNTLETLLGAAVCEELSRIDSCLDELEKMVLEIEGSLSGWAAEEGGAPPLSEICREESYVDAAA